MEDLCPRRDYPMSTHGMAPFASMSDCLAEFKVLMNAAGRAASALSLDGSRTRVITPPKPPSVTTNICNGTTNVLEWMRRRHGDEGLGLAE